MSTTTETRDGAIGCRRFSLGDAVIAVAALALCFTAARVYVPWVQRSFLGVPPFPLSRPGEWWDYPAKNPMVVKGALLYGSSILIVHLVIGSLAFAVIRLRMPRPALGRVASQPGMVAFLALIGGFVLGGASGMLGMPRFLAGGVFASAVPLAWTVLALRQRWRPEPGWIDRLGRVLGACWCVILPAYVLFSELFLETGTSI